MRVLNLFCFYDRNFTTVDFAKNLVLVREIFQCYAAKEFSAHTNTLAHTQLAELAKIIANYFYYTQIFSVQVDMA